MATPTADKLRVYLPSKYLTVDGQVVTQQIADTGTEDTIVDSALTEIDDYWNGAIGWFDGQTTNAALRGVFFHIKDFDAATDTLTLAKELPASPMAGDLYYLVLGGNYRSSHEIFGMLVGGKLPELETVLGTNITGLTIKKASALLGTSETALTVAYDQTLSLLKIKMGAEAYGVGLDVSGNVNDGIVFAADGHAYLQVDVVAASLPGSSQTDVFTLAYPEGTLTPDYEGYETQNVNGGKTRYRLEVVKNEDAVDGMVGLAVYAGKPPGTSSTIAAGPTLGLAAGSLNITDASDWPTRGFWIRCPNVNTGAGDCRYVKYRSGNTIYCHGASDWAILNFDAGSTEIKQNYVITGFTSSASAVVDQIFVISGTWGANNAAGWMILKKVAGTFANDELIKVGALTSAVADGASVPGLRGYQGVSLAPGAVIELMADVDLGMDDPNPDQFENPTTEAIAPVPAVVTFATADDVASAIAMGNLSPAEKRGVWRREWIVDEHQSRSGIIADTFYSWS